MNATKKILETPNIQNIFRKLDKRKNFLYTEIWPEYGHVIEFFESKNCFAALTDSGGVQEEMNLLGKMCFTCRFNTDRPETINQARSNLLVPPMDSKFMVKMIRKIKEDENLQKNMCSSPKLYGNEVGDKFISIVKNLMESNKRLFNWAHEELGLWKEKKLFSHYL